MKLRIHFTGTAESFTPHITEDEAKRLLREYQAYVCGSESSTEESPGGGVYTLLPPDGDHYMVVSFSQVSHIRVEP